MPRPKSAAEEVAASFKCSGQSQAWGARQLFLDDGTVHPAYKRHPPCWHCNADLGCARCSGPTRELLCKNCHDWGHQDALAEHGPLITDPAKRQQAMQQLRILVGEAVR